MPIYLLTCPNGCTTEEYCHTAADRGSRTHLCNCGETMAHILSLGSGLTWFEEGRGRWINHLADRPVYVTSHRQHQALMREHKVEWATERTKTGTGGWT